MMPLKKADVIAELQMDILRLERFRSVSNPLVDLGLGLIKDALPHGSFPTGAIHEFLCSRSEDAAATGGFIAGVLTLLMRNTGTALWISSSRTLFPPALKSFGIEPDRFIFIDLKKEKEVIWAMEEALKCGALSAVVGEIREIDFTASRRLQLAVEKSEVTGFIIRNKYHKLTPTACVSRWQITSLPAEQYENLPGVNFPKWKVELLRMRNGKAGVWEIQWKNGRFNPVYKSSSILEKQQRKAG